KNSSYNPLVANRSNLYLQIDPSSYAGFNYDTASKTGNAFFVQHLDGNKVDYNLRAETIRWDTAHNNWILDNVIERRINGLKETVTMTPTMSKTYTFRPFDLKRDEYTKDRL